MEPVYRLLILQIGLEHEDWLEETNMDSLRYFPFGLLQKILLQDGQRKSEVLHNEK